MMVSDKGEWGKYRHIDTSNDDKGETTSRQAKLLLLLLVLLCSIAAVGVLGL